MQDAALAQLARWGISEAEATRAELFDVDDAGSIYSDFSSLPAIVIPYYAPDGSPVTFQRGGEAAPFCRVRYLEQPSSARGFTAHRPQRYGQPADSGTPVYWPPVLAWPAMLADVAQPLVVTEGEAKALAGALAGFPVLAFGGVFNWTLGDELLPELQAIPWRNRDVYLCFDSDAALNPNILAAEARLVDELQRKAGARCFLVRLPQPGDDKVGLDDYLRTEGPAALGTLFAEAAPLGALDAKVVSLNKSVAWIEQEGAIYDLEEKRFITKANFVNGSRFSTLKHITVSATQRAAPRHISVADTALTHPHFQRYGEILFRPGETRVVTSEQGRPALNMWAGWTGVEGDVEPFLRLTSYLFQHLPADVAKLPLRLMAYKAQNPAEKIPLAPVLVGPQGSGKSLWGECLTAAFRPYSTTIASKQFGGDYQGWMENTLLCVINEVEPDHLKRYGERLKSLISDRSQRMNEKYRPERDIKSFTQYILTGNNRAIGSYASDDRRMIVIDTPTAGGLDPAIYETLGENHGAWFHGGGPAALLDYLLTLDLRGWRPPARAPMTAEKHMAYMEGLSALQMLASQMRTADYNTVIQWLDSAAAWATAAELGPNSAAASAARAISGEIGHIAIRPWYEPRELAMMFPMLVEAAAGSKYDRTTPPGQISRELRDAGVPYLVNRDDPMGFKWRGQVRQYLVVCDFDDWCRPITQADFERAMADWPTYGQVRRRP